MSLFTPTCGRNKHPNLAIAKAGNAGAAPAGDARDFAGKVKAGADYLMVDDVGFGGTFANLRGYIEANGGHVLAMTALTERRGQGNSCSPGYPVHATL